MSRFRAKGMVEVSKAATAATLDGYAWWEMSYTSHTESEPLQPSSPSHPSRRLHGWRGQGRPLIRSPKTQGPAFFEASGPRSGE